MIWIQNESFSTKWYSTSYASCIYTFLPLAITRSYFAELLEPLLRRCFLHGSALINMTLFCAWQKFWGVLFIRADDTHANWNFRRMWRVIFVRAAIFWFACFQVRSFHQDSAVHGNFKQGSFSASALTASSVAFLVASLRYIKTERERTPHLFVDEKQIAWIFILTP